MSTHRFLVQAVPADDPAPLSREDGAKFGTDAIHKHRLKKWWCRMGARRRSLRRRTRRTEDRRQVWVARPQRGCGWAPHGAREQVYDELLH